MPSLAYPVMAETVIASLSTGTRDLILVDQLRAPDKLKAFELSCIEVLESLCDFQEVSHEVWWAAQALKKYSAPIQGGISPDQRRKEAVSSFLVRNDEARSHGIPHLSERVRRLVAQCLPPVTREDVDVNRFGPGAVEEGFSVLGRWEALANIGPSWLRSPLPWELSKGLVPSLGDARLCAVPKSAWKDRLITVEPFVASFGQQYTRQMMLQSIHRGRLRGTPSDFLLHPDGRNVEIQQERCLRASFLGDEATLDLSDASDSISIEQVDWLFPDWLWPYLRAFRSDKVKDLSGATHNLNIYAGMGNATTFLVETVLFYAVFTAISEQLVFRPAEVSVYGDDVIVDARVANHPRFVDMVSQWGFRINHSKSFSRPDCHFRESCGRAALAGHALTEPLRIDDPGGAMRKIAAAGLVTRASQSTLPCHHIFASLLLEQNADIPVCHGYPHQESSVAFTWVSEERGNSRVRWNPRTQNMQVRALVSSPRIIRYSSKRKSLGALLGSLAEQVHTRPTRLLGGRLLNVIEEAIPKSNVVTDGWVSYDTW